MPNSSTEPAQFLRRLILRLVEVEREINGFSFHLLERVTLGRTGLIEIDGHRLLLTAAATRPYRLHVETQPAPELPLHISIRGQALRAILVGRRTLDRALVDGDIFVRAELPDLLGMHALVMSLLADSPIHEPLRSLWHEWDRDWPYLGAFPEPVPFEEQHARHGELIALLPDRMLTLEHLFGGRDALP